MKKKKVDLVKQAAIARQDAARMEQMSQATGYNSRRPYEDVNQHVARTSRKAAREQ